MPLMLPSHRGGLDTCRGLVMARDGDEGTAAILSTRCSLNRASLQYCLSVTLHFSLELHSCTTVEPLANRLVEKAPHDLYAAVASSSEPNTWKWKAVAGEWKHTFHAGLVAIRASVAADPASSVVTVLVAGLVTIAPAPAPPSPTAIADHHTGILTAKLSQ